MNEKYFSTRASVRDFSDREIPSVLLEKILEEASHAPNTGNMQLYSVVVSRDPEMKRQLAPLHFSQPASLKADVILTVCADVCRFSRWARLSDADPGFDNPLSFISAMTDAVILAQQITTIAELNGLGTCYLGTVTYNAEKISDLLRLPELVVPVACLALGYPASEPVSCERLSTSAWVHSETYRDDSDERIMEEFRAKDDYVPNRRFVEENGKKTLAQVFCDVRYPRSMNEEFSKGFVELLRKKGFLL